MVTLERRTRTEIIQIFGQKVWGHTNYPTSKEYTQVHRKLITTYPILLDAIVSGILSSCNLQSFSQFSFHKVKSLFSQQFYICIK